MHGPCTPLHTCYVPPDGGGAPSEPSASSSHRHRSCRLSASARAHMGTSSACRLLQACGSRRLFRGVCASSSQRRAPCPSLCHSNRRVQQWQRSTPVGVARMRGVRGNHNRPPTHARTTTMRPVKSLPTSQQHARSDANRAAPGGRGRCRLSGSSRSLAGLRIPHRNRH